MRFEGACRIYCQVYCCLALQRGSVGQEENAEVGSEKMPARPSGRDSLKPLDADLGRVMALIVRVVVIDVGPAAAGNSALGAHDLELLGGHATWPTRPGAGGSGVQVWQSIVVSDSPVAHGYEGRWRIGQARVEMLRI